jgi:hypothetical protein
VESKGERGGRLKDLVPPPFSGSVSEAARGSYLLTFSDPSPSNSLYGSGSHPLELATSKML